ncbi:hypothetical protein DL240_14485 [Lujinxingia litoralis]|uniref:Uncharacterized protein n=1 Tax=Lujinxingia litoralis TaxID=2211119 RepID=A0A328C3L6_9DELT|nr:hypothetical protein [Lujinxingia litoralis]RAL20888.1 hypothetical protein DL240_14485 [Lujinxingia litoralis]
MDFKRDIVATTLMLSGVALMMMQNLGCQSAPPAAQASEPTPEDARAADPGQAARPLPDMSDVFEAGSCDEFKLIHMAREMYSAAIHLSPDQDLAAEGLRRHCADRRGVEGCTCESLRQFLMRSTYVQSSISQGCARSEECRSEGVCEAVPPNDGSWLKELEPAVLLSRAASPGVLSCGDSALCQASNAGCARSANCALKGNCALGSSGSCVPTRDEHCLQSQNCQQSGHCALEEGRDYCTIDRDASCLRSDSCRIYGDCSYTERGGCDAQSQELCEASQGCRDHGRCFLSAEVPGDVNDMYSEFYGKRRQCYSKVDEAVEHTVRMLWTEAYAAASLIPLRAGLERFKQEQGKFETYQDYWQLNRDGVPDPDDEDRHVRVNLTLDQTSTQFYVECRQAMELAADVLAPQVWRWEGFEVKLEPYRVVTDDHVLIDSRNSYCSGYRSNNGDSVALVSWVGPILTVSHAWESTDSRTTVFRYWKSYDLRSGEEAPVDALVEMASVIEAFKKDPWVDEQITSYVRGIEERHARGDETDERLQEVREWVARFEASDSPEELSTMFNERVDYEKVELAQGPYALGPFDEERGLVKMYLAVTSYEAVHLTDFITLKLWVKPRPEYLEAIKRGDGIGALVSEGDLTPGGFDVLNIHNE